MTFMRRGGKLPEGLALSKDEAVELTVDGCLSHGRNVRWCLGQWTCTNRRLLFAQGGRAVWEISYPKMLSFNEEDRDFAFGKRTALAIGYCGKDAQMHTVWAQAVGLAQEVRKWCGQGHRTITEGDLHRLARLLKPEAELIVWHLWKHLHLTIQELSSLLNISNHTVILAIIHEEINVKAEAILGYPFMVFEHQRRDEISGMEIRFSWWMTGLPSEEGRDEHGREATIN